MEIWISTVIIPFGGGEWGRALGGAVIWVSELLILKTQRKREAQNLSGKSARALPGPGCTSRLPLRPSRGWRAHFWRPLPEAAFLSMPVLYLLKLLRGQHHPAVCLVILWGENQPNLWATCEALSQGSCVPAWPGVEEPEPFWPYTYIYGD